MADDIVIKTEGLTRYFGAKRAVYELNLKVPRGCVFGILGRNGSGKTTTIRMLLGLLRPTRGSANVLGESSANLSPKTRARIGYLTEGHQVMPWMTVRDCRNFQAPFYPNWDDRIFDAVVDHFGVSPKSRFKELSRGERAGVCLAFTMAPDPELLILDDPALGLDPYARRTLVESMVQLTRKEGRTIFFSSHAMSDVERVADHIAIMDRSVLRAACPIETFRERVTRRVLKFKSKAPDIPDLPGILDGLRTRDEIRLTLANPTAETDAALRSLNPVEMDEVAINLEDAVISYLGDRRVKSFVIEKEEQAA